MSLKINKRKLFQVILLLVLTMLLLLLLAGVWDFASGALTDDKVVVIPEGAGTLQVASVLHEAGAVHSAALFYIAAQIGGADCQWHAGTYTVAGGSGYTTLIKQLTTPQLADIKVVIPEGTQLKQIAVLLDKAGVCAGEDFLTACAEDTFAYDFLEGTAKEGRNRLEGYLFPDTYYFYAKTSAVEVVNNMLERFGEVIYTADYRQRAAELGYSLDEIITLASMVESEAPLESDRRLIAGIFYNRLQHAADYPCLQSCVTVEYALGIKKTIISYEDTEYDSPYNTYLYPGLPIGPICCPGEMSVRAALWPENNDYYYFQSDEEGNIHYAGTLSEHAAIQDDVQSDWETGAVEVIGEQ